MIFFINSNIFHFFSLSETVESLISRRVLSSMLFPLHIFALFLVRNYLMPVMANFHTFIYNEHYEIVHEVEPDDRPYIWIGIKLNKREWTLKQYTFDFLFWFISFAVLKLEYITFGLESNAHCSYPNPYFHGHRCNDDRWQI